MGALRAAAAIVAATGLVVLVIAFLVLQSRLAMIRTWRPVTAQVVRSSMEQRSSADDSGTHYFALYELNYVVDGRALHKTARSDISFTTPAAIQERIARHAPGTQGVIYVNPADPSQTRLNLGKNAITLGLPLWLMLGGVAGVLIGFSLWWMGSPGHLW